MDTQSDKVLWDLEQPVSTAVRSRKPISVKRITQAGIAVVLLLATKNTILNHVFPHSTEQHNVTVPDFEKHFLSVPSAASALQASRRYATYPHLAGSVEDFEDAKSILKLFQDNFNIAPPSNEPVFSAGSVASQTATRNLTHWGAPKEPSAWIDVYYPLMNTPLSHSLEVLESDGTVTWTADLEEVADPLDPEAYKYKDAVPIFHGLSADGDVTGPLVYVNYGRKEDYDELVAQGTNFTGVVVVARYGGVFRGLKIKGAEELGAAGVLIYSDPRDDGYVTVANGYAPYPEGPARNPSSVQRGSVTYLSKYPGDPTTPGYPAYENATRSDPECIPEIPSLPISWKTAERLAEEAGEEDMFKALTGKVSTKHVRLVNRMDTKITPIWNTMSAIPGHIKDEIVVIGGHRDAWVMGAADPTSGTVSLHEVVRGFGALLEQGWKPLRTIVFASWDGEEYGLLGSTEWGEDFADWIQKHAVAYFNVDVSASGSHFNMAASPLLSNLIKKTAQDIPHPTSPGKSLWDARDDSGPFTGKAHCNVSDGAVDQEVLAQHSLQDAKRKSSRTQIHPLGSGSDFTVFLQRLGVASSDQGFGQTPSDAPYHYHSIYDSQAWQERYADPTFGRHVAVAKQLGLLVLRTTDSVILPLDTTAYALELDDYLDTVEKIQSETNFAADLAPLRKSIKRLQRASKALDTEKEIAEKKFKKALSRLRHKRRVGPWKRILHWIRRKTRGGCKKTLEREDMPYGLTKGDWLDWISSDKEVTAIPSGHRMRKFIRAAKRVQKANSKLIAFERGFISKEGIKDREWYRHLGVAPGKWLGYGATTFPGLTEAIAYEKNTTLAAHEASRLTDLLDKLTEVLEA